MPTKLQKKSLVGRFNTPKQKTIDKESCLSAEQFRKDYSYDPLTGLITKEKNGFVYRVGSSKSPVIRVGEHLYLYHRLVWLYMTGEWPKTYCIDHKNGDYKDNRWENLREATSSQNSANKKSNSLHPGVRWNRLRGAWESSLQAGRLYKLGNFTCFALAIKARNTAEKELLGEFAFKRRNTTS